MTTFTEEICMEDLIDRRRFVTFAGAAGVAGLAGCFGDDEQPPVEGENDGGDSGGSDDDNGGDGDDEGTEESEEAVPFDFPPGAGESGIVTETVVAGSRQFIEKADRYRIEQTHELDPSDASTDESTFTYDVDDRLVHERYSEAGLDIDRWVTPERTVGRTSDDEADRTGRWQSRTADPNGSFRRYPFEETAVPSLLESASFEFDEIVTGEGTEDEDEAEQRYARYVGKISGSESLDLQQPKSARTDYLLESTSDGSVSMLLAESGAIRSVEYELFGDGVRLTHEGRDSIEIAVGGDVRFEYDEKEAELDSLEPPGWVESPDPDEVRSFEIEETSLGQTYRLADGPTLPGSLEQEYAEFYLTAEFDSERYIDRYTPRTEFDTREGVVAWLQEGRLELDWASFSGRDALKEADRIEMSVYLYAPGEGRTMVFHEERYP